MLQSRLLISARNLFCVGIWFYFCLFYFFFLFQCYKENKSQPAETGRPGVIISNHVSYIDILYHMSNSFPSFVAKVCVVFTSFSHAPSVYLKSIFHYRPFFPYWRLSFICCASFQSWILSMKRSVGKIPLVGLIRSVSLCLICLNMSYIFFISMIIQNVLLTYYGLFL